MKKEDIFQLSIVIIGIISLIMNFILFKDWRGIFYYTILSNMYVVFFYLSVLLLKRKNKLVKNDKYYMFKGLALLEILCTMVIYNFIVATKDNIYTGHFLTCYSVHLLLPILVFIECCLFQEKKKLKYRYVPIWSIINYSYLFLILCHRKIFNGVFLEGKAYPYEFINFEKLGVVKGMINSGVVLASFIIAGIVMVFIDNKLKNVED